jgi:hypothetical protein
LRRKLGGLWAGIGDGTELRFGQILQVLVVLTAHDTSADQGNTQGGNHALILFLSYLRGRCQGGPAAPLFNLELSSRKIASANWG